MATTVTLAISRLVRPRWYWFVALGLLAQLTGCPPRTANPDLLHDPASDGLEAEQPAEGGGA